jgi:DNA polymerase-3 subunit epsilon
MPARVLAVDVETTGLGTSDRVVSFGGISLDTKSLGQGRFDLNFNHFIFNPEIRCNPAAARVHGYSDWTLQTQERFVDRVGSICEMIDTADLIVAHNAEFDIGFLDRELVAAGKLPIAKPSYCTMTEWRRREMPGSASLTNVSAFFGFHRAAEYHGALEDAWLALMIYLCFCGCTLRFPFEKMNNLGPTNFRPAGPEPAPPMPKVDLAQTVATAKRERRYSDAEVLLLSVIEWREAMGRTSGVVSSLWAYEQLAVIYRKQKRWTDEAAVLKRYLSLPNNLRAASSDRIRQRLVRAMGHLKGVPTEDPCPPTPSSTPPRE